MRNGERGRVGVYMRSRAIESYRERERQKKRERERKRERKREKD